MGVTPNDRDFVSALERGLSVITSFGEGAEDLTLVQAATKSDLTRGTARRFLLTLEGLGYVQAEGKIFRLTSMCSTSDILIWRLCRFGRPPNQS